MPALPFELDRTCEIQWRGSGEGEAVVDEGWTIGPVVNGGLLMAMATTAAIQASGTGHGHPVAWSSHFHEAVRPGPVRVRAERLRAGRGFTSMSVDLRQQDSVRVTTLVTLGDLATLGDHVHASPAPPVLPEPDACLRADRSAPGSSEVALLDRLDLRLDPSTAMWALGQPSRRGVMRAWIRFADARPIDVAALPLVVDAMPPVALDMGGVGWAPTLALTGSVRSVPVDGWLRVEIRTSTVVGGLLEEDATVWDDTGAVVAHSRQIAGVSFAGPGRS